MIFGVAAICECSEGIRVVQYLEFLVEQRQVLLARRTFDRALQALPITQHDRIWTLYLVCALEAGFDYQPRHSPSWDFFQARTISSANTRESG